MIKKIKVYNAWNKPRGKKQDFSNPIYEYEYLDRKTGETKKQKINMQERIDSNLDRTDYKKQIMRGELELNGISAGEGIRDFTSLPGDKANLIDFIAKIGRMDSNEIDNLVKSVAEQPKEEPSENRKQDKQTIDTTKQDKPDSGGNIGKTTEGSEQ